MTKTTSLAIYIEGGGDSANGKAQLRLGFDALLSPQKDAARKRKMGWKLVLCGGRNAAFDAFQHATKSGAADIVVLLVDAEAAVSVATPEGRLAHLATRDGWSIAGVIAERVHLMTQCMEAWIVADPEALAAFYGQHFNANALPKRLELGDEPKQSIYDALEAATRAKAIQNGKGNYGKIKHASELLKKINPAVVASRCMSFAQFTAWLNTAIAST